MKDFHDLLVWQHAHRVVLDVYRLTHGFPRQELFGLVSQLRRSCVSIPANIAEGCGRRSDGDFSRFLSIAMGSACETEYHLLLAMDLGLITPTQHEETHRQLIDVKRMLASLIQTLERGQATRRTGTRSKPRAASS